MLKLILLAALSLGLAACIPTQPTSYLVAAADPAAGTRLPAYSSVTAGVRAYEVVDPLDWRELNRRVAPGAGTEAERGNSNDAARRGR
ncbi:hypothetical protein [Microvirga antarctica]|uniref:hypothetical protein n=1 Tax=Microvirga antarctica TaxID=2819233 RepID=UPI001B310BE6|nr:hypothetical protein [Microvirga antarctica]